MTDFFVIQFQGTKGAFHLELDTTPPIVTFGAVSSVEAGQLLQVAYTLNAEEIDESPYTVLAAVIIPSSGPQETLSIFPDHVEAVLSPAIAGGPAIVRLTTSADDVGNFGVYDLNVTVVAPTGTPTGFRGRGPGIVPTAPARRRRPQPVLRGVRSRIRTRSALHLEARGYTVRGSTQLASEVRTRARPPAPASRLGPTSRSATSVLVKAQTGVSTSTRVPRARRRDGSEQEAMLLDLLL